MIVDYSRSFALLFGSDFLESRFIYLLIVRCMF